MNEKMLLGLNVKNALAMGSGETDDKLPVRSHVGVGYQVMPGFWMAMDMEAAGRFAMGAEYNFGKFLALQVGKAPNGSLSMGTGLTYKNARLDMAFNQNTAGLGSSVSTSMTLRFGQNREALRVKLSGSLLTRGLEMVKRGEWVTGLRLLKKSAALNPANTAAKDGMARLNGILKILKVRRPTDLQKYRGKEVWYLLRNSVAAYMESSYREAELFGAYASIKDGEEPKLRDLVLHMERESGVQALTQEEKDMSPEAFLVTKRRRVEEKFHKKEYGISLLECQEIVSLEPESAEDWEKLGSLYFVIGVKEKAVEAYGRALDLDPDNTELKQFLEKHKAQMTPKKKGKGKQAKARSWAE
jgi:tetratricopeptide (TPR) repeat protein